MVKKYFFYYLLGTFTLTYLITPVSCKRSNEGGELAKMAKKKSIKAEGDSDDEDDSEIVFSNEADPSDSESVTMNMPCARTVLPNHEILWRALASMQIKYSSSSYVNTGGHKNYIGILKDLLEELEYRQRESNINLPPRANDVLPFTNPETKTRFVTHRINLLKNSQAVLGPRNAVDKVRSWTKRSHYDDASAAKKVVTVVGMTAVDLTPNPVTLVGMAASAITGFGTNLYKASMQTYSYSYLKDVTPDEGELDSDRCICDDQMCDKVAKLYVRRSNELIGKYGIKVIPIVGKYCYAAQKKVTTIIKKSRGKINYENEQLEKRFKERQVLADYLWEAAQTRIIHRNIDVSKEKKQNWSEWGIPFKDYDSIFIEKKGCPKAIAIIASMFGDYYQYEPSNPYQSNYLRTLAVITAQDGKEVIRQGMYWR